MEKAQGERLFRHGILRERHRLSPQQPLKIFQRLSPPLARGVISLGEFGEALEDGASNVLTGQSISEQFGDPQPLRDAEEVGLVYIRKAEVHQQPLQAGLSFVRARLDHARTQPSHVVAFLRRQMGQSL